VSPADMPEGDLREPPPSGRDVSDMSALPDVPAAPRDVLDTDAAGGLIIRGGVLRFGSYVGVVLLSVLSAALLTRYLGVSRFGEYTTVISLVTIVSSITDAGMSSLGTREFAVRHGPDREALMRDLLGLRVALTLVGVVLATAFVLAAGYDSALVAGTVLASLATVALVLQHTLSIPLTTALRIGVLSVLELARQAVTVVLIVLVIVGGGGVLPLLGVSLVVNLLLIPATARVARGEISLRFQAHPRRWMALLAPTLYFSLAAAANTLYLYMAQILTSVVASGQQSGLFAAAFRVFIVVVAVPGILVGGAFPVLARAARDDRARLGYALQRTFEASLILGVAAVLAVVGGAQLIIDVIGGSKYAGSVDVLRIEGFALLASFTLASWGYGLLALHRHRALLLSNLLALLVSATLTGLLAASHGARGAALASVCGESTLALLYLLALVRGHPEYRPQHGVALRVMLAAVPACVVALVPGLPAVVQPIAALAVFAALAVLLRAIPDELYELLPARLRRGSA
jgi:O-antigen/teichoic acid export membrane protein